MGTFPSAYDYGRPAPPSPTEVVGAPRAAEAPQISNVGAQAADAEGQMLQRTAAAVDDYGLHLDTISAQDAVNKLRQQKADLTYGADNGFMKVQGGDVLKQQNGQSMLQAWSDRLSAAKDQIGANLSPRARMMFNQRATEETTAFQQELLKHQLVQTENYRDAVFKDTTATLLTEAQRNSADPAALDGIALKVEKAARVYAAQKGLPADNLVASSRSNVYRMGIENLISKNDGPGALALFNATKDKLDATDLLAVQGQVKTVQVGQTARSYVAGISVPDAQRRDKIMKSVMDLGLGSSPEDAAAWAANFYNESRFGTTVAVNPGDGSDGSDSINMGQWNGARAQAFHQFAAKNKLDESDPATAIKYAKAEIDGVIPYSVSGISPDLKNQLANAKTADEKAAILSNGYFKPAGGAGEASARGQRAGQFVKDYTSTHDPLAAAVNASAPVPGVKAEGPPGFLDTRQMTIDAEKWHIQATQQNMHDWSANPTQMAANQHLIDVQFEQKKAAIQLAQTQLTKSVEDWVTKGGPGGGPAIERPPPEIWNQLTFEKQRSIDRTLAVNAKGKDRPTDMVAYYGLERMAGTDPGTFANVNLLDYYPKLSNADFKHFSDLQKGQLQKDPTEGDLRTKQAIVKDAAVAAGLKWESKDPDDQAKTNEYLKWVEEAAASWAQQNGRKPTGQEWQKIVDGVTMNIPNGSLGHFFPSSDTPLFKMTVSDVPAEAKQQYLKAFATTGAPEPSDHDLIAMRAAQLIGAVPASMVPVVAAELKRRNKAVTPQTILGGWRLLKAVREREAP